MVYDHRYIGTFGAFLQPLGDFWLVVWLRQGWRFGVPLPSWEADHAPGRPLQLATGHGLCAVSPAAGWQRPVPKGAAASL